MATLGSREDVGRQLLELKERLERQNSKRSELQGELKSSMKQLKQNHGIDTLEQAEALYDKSEKEFGGINEDLQAKVNEIREALEDDQYQY